MPRPLPLLHPVGEVLGVFIEQRPIVSSVIAAEARPNIRCTALIAAPAEIARDAGGVAQIVD